MQETEYSRYNPVRKFYFKIHEKCRVDVPEDSDDPRLVYYNVWYNGKVWQMPNSTGSLYAYSMSEVAAKFDLDQLVALTYWENRKGDTLVEDIQEWT